MKGTRHSARTTTTEWPDEKGIPGVYLHVEYTDGIVEWTAMDLFGDTVQIIPAKTKKMRHNTRSRKRKQDQSLEYTERFPEEATEWLGYGSLVSVKFNSRWCPRQVTSRGERGVLVQYSDGVGEHDDLHKRGCRVKVVRRRVNMEELRNCTPQHPGCSVHSEEVTKHVPAGDVAPRSGLRDILCQRSILNNKVSEFLGLTAKWLFTLNALG